MKSYGTMTGQDHMGNGVGQPQKEYMPDLEEDSEAIVAEVERLHRKKRPDVGRRQSSKSSRSSRRESFVASVTAPVEGLGVFPSTCIVISYISAGYVLLPHAFAQGGTVLSCVVLAMVAAQTYMTATFILEACARAECLEQIKGNLRISRRYSMAIRERKFELSVLSKVFLKPWEEYLFTFTTLGDLYGITWALCTVCASGFAEQHPIGGVDDSYKIYVLIFIAIAVPLSATSITDMLGLQMLFLLLRTIMVLLMVGTLTVAYISGDTHFGTQPGPVNDVPVLNLRNIVLVAMTSIFSSSYQFSVPALAGVTQEKKKVSNIFRYGTTYIYVKNIIVSTMASIYFGQIGTDSSANLNWSNYHGGTATSDGFGGSRWANTISWYIVMFAAIDCLAVYPLMAVTLGDILMGAVFGDRVHEYENNWKVRGAFRILGSVPQAIGAMFVSSLGIIATYAGIFTLLSYTVCPSVLVIRSREKMREKGLPEMTYYSTVLSRDIWAYGLIFLACLLIVGVIVDGATS